MTGQERGELALYLVGLTLSLAAFVAEHPALLTVPGFALSGVMLASVLRRLSDGVR